MHVLVAINNNLSEWAGAYAPGGGRPRLPLVYPFSAALARGSHQVSALDLCSRVETETRAFPFVAQYHRRQLTQAMRRVDIAALWGALGVAAVGHQLAMPSPRRRVVLCTYVWRSSDVQSLRVRKLELATRLAAYGARAVVTMTGEQASLARRDLPPCVPVILLRCGIDTRYYADVTLKPRFPEASRCMIERILKGKFVVMPGDELRLNEDAIEIAIRTGLPLVRVTQYPDKSATDAFRQHIHERHLETRVLILEKIDYQSMRFLLQNASAYVGLVDSRWQPAGWTVACEALASGLPVVLYEGLVARELRRLGAGRDLVRAVPMRDTRRFVHELETTAGNSDASAYSGEAREFARRVLDLELTGETFRRDLESALA